MFRSQFPVPRPIKSLAVALGALAILSTPGLAQGSEGRMQLEAVEVAQPAVQPPVDPEPWHFNATGYAWLMGITGSVTARGQNIATNASFIDLVQKSDSLVGFMGYFEADKGKVGIYTDLVFSKLGFAASQVDYRNPLPRLKISTQASAALTYQVFIAEMGGVYEVAKWKHSETSWTALDGLLAFRYWNNQLVGTFDADVNFDIGRRFKFERSFGLAIDRTDVIQWVDPVIGFRVRHQFTPRQELMVRGDIGGFGLSGNQFSWQAVAAYGYGWFLEGGQKLTAMVGFRALSVNYSSGWGDEATAINEVMYGPIIGVSFRF